MDDNYSIRVSSKDRQNESLLIVRAWQNESRRVVNEGGTRILKSLFDFECRSELREREGESVGMQWW